MQAQLTENYTLLNAGTGHNRCEQPTHTQSSNMGACQTWKQQGTGHAAQQDAHPVGHGQVLDGRALRQELRVGQDLKLHVGVRAVAPQHLAPQLEAENLNGRPCRQVERQDQAGNWLQRICAHTGIRYPS